MIAFMFFLLSFCFVFSGTTKTDSTKIIKKLDASFNLTSTSISPNWYKGGNNSMNWALRVLYNIIVDNTVYNVTNNGKIGYGKTHLSGVENGSRISTNEIMHETIYTKKIGMKVEPFISASIQTQITEGFSYEKDTVVAISGFFDPAYLTQAIGFGYSTEDLLFNLRLGFSLQETVAKKYGVEKTDRGLKLDSSYKIEYQNVNILMTLTAFSTLEKVKETDVFFDFSLASNISRYFKLSFDLNFRYDFDFSHQRQVQHVLGIGLFYSFL